MSLQTSNQNIIGRDELISRIWQHIKNGRSLKFTAERRIGKTSVMQKMLANPPQDIHAIFIDLSRVDSPIRFVEVLAQELRSKRSIAKRVGDWLKPLMGTQVSVMDVNITIPENKTKDWRTILESLLDHICRDSNLRMVLLLDELPYMLIKIHAQDKKQSSHNALEILDLLRAARQEYSNLQMIFAGSVGIHHVIKDIKGQDSRQKSPSQPLNDLYSIEIKVLESDYAKTCAKDKAHLIGLSLSDEQALEVISVCNNTPFYMEKLLSELQIKYPSGDFEVADITTCFRTLIADDVDHWELRHFKDRLPIYYSDSYTDASSKEQPCHKLAETILNELAISPQAMSINEVFNAAKNDHALSDHNLETVRALLIDLAEDHYLKSTLDASDVKRYQFKYDLIQGWWRISQGLSPTKNSTREV